MTDLDKALLAMGYRLWKHVMPQYFKLKCWAWQDEPPCEYFYKSNYGEDFLTQKGKENDE